jgi:hypothetical protein
MAQTENPMTRLRNGIQIDGRDETINSIAVTVNLRNANGDILHCEGLTKPTDGSTGYAKGCIFIDTDVAGGTGAFYVNKGTKTSCTFTLVTQA